MYSITKNNIHDLEKLFLQLLKTMHFYIKNITSFNIYSSLFFCTSVVFYIKYVFNYF